MMKKELTIDSFKFKILRFLFLASLLLLVVLIYFFYISSKQNFSLSQQKSDEYLHKTINHIINHNQEQYSNTLLRIADTLEIAKLVKLKQREKILETLTSKFEQLKEENSYIKTMHIIDDEGISFLRLHQKDIFGDDLKTFRPMTRVALQLKKPVYGYEAGKFGNVYRVIVPLFYKKEFVGLLGLGLETKYFLNTISELLDEKGFVFLNEKLSSLHKIDDSKQNVKIDKYILIASSGELKQKDTMFLKSLPLDYHFEDSYEFQYNDKSYMLHANTIENFLKQTIGYYLFVQDITLEIEQRNKFIRNMIIIFLLIFILVFLVIRYYILKFEDEISNFYQVYKYAINGTKAGLWDWNLQTNEIYFNARWKEMLGYKEDELENIFQTWEERVHPDDLKKAKIDLEKNIHKETEYFENIHRLKHKDGSWVWIFDRGKAFFDREGKPERMVGFHTDITKIQQVNEEVMKLKSAFDKSPISIIMTDLNANITYVNPNWCKMTGYSKEEVIGKNPRFLKSGYVDDDGYKKMWEHLLKGKIWSGDIKNIAKDGSEFWEESTIFSSYDSLGNINGFIGFKLEITDKKKMAIELQENEKIMMIQSKNAAMGEMISMIAHQWRQPLSVISMGANNILADIELDMIEQKTLKEISIEILEQTNELSKIIDDFKEFFKPIKKAEYVSLDSVVEQVLKIIGKSLENNNITVLKKYETNKKVEVYLRELMQVFINILNNSKEILIEKNTKNPQINIVIKEKDDTIQIAFSDNAGGVDDKIKDKIFEPYFSTKDEKIGTGLGLYMSKIIIEKHHKGTLEFFNKEGGASFVIRIPFKIERKEQ